MQFSFVALILEFLMVQLIFKISRNKNYLKKIVIFEQNKIYLIEFYIYSFKENLYKYF